METIEKSYNVVYAPKGGAAVPVGGAAGQRQPSLAIVEHWKPAVCTRQSVGLGSTDI